MNQTFDWAQLTQLESATTNTMRRHCRPWIHKQQPDGHFLLNVNQYQPPYQRTFISICLIEQQRKPQIEAANRHITKLEWPWANENVSPKTPLNKCWWCSCVVYLLCLQSGLTWFLLYFLQEMTVDRTNSRLHRVITGNNNTCTCTTSASHRMSRYKIP